MTLNFIWIWGSSSCDGGGFGILLHGHYSEIYFDWKWLSLYDENPTHLVKAKSTMLGMICPP